MSLSFGRPKAHPATKLWLGATLKDVAKRAGVARSTVSAILADKPHCYASQETRQRVLDAAQELNYQPNVLSRALLGQQTHTLGLIVRNLVGPTLKLENVAAIEQLAQQRGYRLLIAAHENNATREENIIRSFLSQHVDGLIVEPTDDGQSDPLYSKIIREGMPLIAVDPSAPIDAPQVCIDRQHGASLQVRHLADLGRRRFVFVNENADHPFGQAKTRGYRQALGEAGIDPDAQLWLKPPYLPGTLLSEHPLVGMKLVNELLASGRLFDAVVTSSDTMALGAMRALFKAGRRIPQDVAIAGFHDEMFSASLPVSLTTVRHPPDVDRLVFDLLMKQLGESGTQDDNSPPEEVDRARRIVCTPSLVVRESTTLDPPRGNA